MLQKQKTTWRGIRRHGAGWQAEVRVKGHPRSVAQFPLDTDVTTIQKWRKQERDRLKKKRPPSTAGTFAADVRQKYLPTKKASPTYDERCYHMELWIAEFGGRHRSSIQPYEIAAVRDRWLTEGPRRVWRKWAEDGDPRPGGRYVLVAEPLSASQVNKRLRALQNFYTVLDGRQGENPVREIDEADEDERAARGLPYDVVEAILAQIPDRRYDRKLTAEQLAAVQQRTRKRSANASEIARDFGISETMVRKIRRRAMGPERSTPNAAKLWLRAIAYTGFAHSELTTVVVPHLHLDETPPWVWMPGRKKGDGTAGTAQPLTDEGAASLRALVQAGLIHDEPPTISNSSLRQSLGRACRKLGLTGIRPYDLRHSFASEMLEKTGGNAAVTQLLMRHKDLRTTLQYAKRAINPVLAAAIASVRAAGAFNAKTVSPTFAASKNAPASVK